MSTDPPTDSSSNAPPAGPDQFDTHDPQIAASLRKYWRTNVLIMATLLLIWAFVGLGCGVLWADWLNTFKLFNTGYPLGFWFAQQGSIITFVLLILIYCVLLNRLDRRHHEELVAIRQRRGGQN